MKHLNEELLYSLPDYINGQIRDQKLISEIETEIANNPDFKLEYENLKNTFSFLEKTNFEEPSEAYFNNLLPNIRAKLDAQKQKKRFNILDYLAPSLKYVLPAFCIMFIVYVYTKNPSIEQVANINQPETTIVNETTNTASNDNLNNSGINNSEVLTKTPAENNSVTFETISEENLNQIESEFSTTDNAFSTDENIYEIQYEGLSSEDEDEILNSLKNSDL